MNNVLRTCIIFVIGFTAVNLTDAWKLVPVERATEMISPWIDIEYFLSRDWVYSIGSWRLIAFLLSILLVIDSKNKAPEKRALYWVLMFVFGFELYRFFLNFNKDNYFYIHLLCFPAYKIIAAIIKYNDHRGIWFETKKQLQKINDWYYNGWKVDHYDYLSKYQQEQPKPQRLYKRGICKHDLPADPPRPRFQDKIERELSPIH